MEIEKKRKRQRETGRRERSEPVREEEEGWKRERKWSGGRKEEGLKTGLGLDWSLGMVKVITWVILGLSTSHR